MDSVKEEGLPSMSFSFSCGGWLMVYHYGVAKAFQEQGLKNKARFIGCSAGALAAAGIVLGCDFEATIKTLSKEYVPKTRSSLFETFKLRKTLVEMIKRHGNVHKYELLNQNSNRATIVYSSLSAFKSRRVSSFESEEALCQAVVASCCATPLAGLPFRLNGEWVIDGGLLDFQPVFDKDTICVSPFYCTKADIRPSRYIPMWWAVYPPSPADFEWVFQLGYEDALTWLSTSGVVDASNIHIPKRAAKYDGEWTTTVGRFMGYRGMESRLLDAIFVTLLVCLYRPITFICLYVELYSRAIISASKAMFYASVTRLMVFILPLIVCVLTHFGVFKKFSMPFFVGILGFGCLLACYTVYHLGGMHEATARASKDWRHCLSCLRSITSLSLFLRSVPVVGTSVTVKRHEFLLEHSYVYRLACHFV